MQMKTVQKAHVVSNFTIPDVGPVRLDGCDVIVDSGGMFWCATHRQAKELIAQRGFVEVSDFDAPGAPRRYFTATGGSNWEFVSSATVGLKRDLSISEREIRLAHYLSGRLGVIRWLVRRGEVDPDQVQVCENADPAKSDRCQGAATILALSPGNGSKAIKRSPLRWAPATCGD